MVLAVEKRVTSKLMVAASVEKIMEMDYHMGCAMSGLTADARILVEKARAECQNHRFTYNEPLPVESCTQTLCDLSLKFGEDDDEDAGGMSRPFGVALLIAGWDEDEGPCLYHTDPSGTYVRYEAEAIGTGGEGARNALKEDYKKDMTLDEGLLLALKTLKQAMEEKMSSTNVDVAVVAPTYKLYTPEEIEAVIARL